MESVGLSEVESRSKVAYFSEVEFERFVARYPALKEYSANRWLIQRLYTHFFRGLFMHTVDSLLKSTNVEEMLAGDPQSLLKATFDTTSWKVTRVATGLNLEILIGTSLYLSNKGRADMIIQNSRGRAHKDPDIKVTKFSIKREVWIEAKNLVSDGTGDIPIVWLERYLIPRFDGATQTTRKVAVVTPVFINRLTPQGQKRLEEENIELVELPLSVTPAILNEDVTTRRLLVDNLFRTANSLLTWLSSPSMSP